MRKFHLFRGELFPDWKRLPEIPGALLSSRLDRSPIPAVLSSILLWAVIIVLLTMAAGWRQEPSFWHEGEKAPFCYEAMVDFQYIDSAETARAKDRAAAAVPLNRFMVSQEKTVDILHKLEQTLDAVRARMTTEAAGAVYSPKGDSITAAVAGIPHFSEHGAKIAELLERNASERKKELQEPGIISAALIENLAGKASVEITLEDHRQLLMQLPELSLTGVAAGKWADPFPAESRDAMNSIFCLCIGEGNLILDQPAIAKLQTAAREKVSGTAQKILKGTHLIEQGETITHAVFEKLAAEKAARPYGAGIEILMPRILIATAAILVICFFLRLTSVSCFRFSLHFSFGLLLLILSLLINCAALLLFKTLWEHNQIHSSGLLVFMVPIPLGIALLTVMQGRRVAIFGGLLISCVMAFLVWPDHALSLILRWGTTGAIVALVMSSVTDHRSFFIRLLLTAFLVPLLLNLDQIFAWGISSGEWAAVAATSAFFSAVGAMILNFFFEIVCNVDTNMSLMVLCGGTHPLLERMKREAPGTMSHCTTAATLAEDAARLIGANALQCKAGALFHDVGKLFRPQAFVENNVDSPGEYEKRAPEKCCEIIRKHVSEGLTLAREYRLSRFFKETILTHHGDDLVGGFYFRALREQEKSPDDPAPVEAAFHYKGYPPFSREQTIIALADGCEAACRSFKHLPSVQELRDMVNNIFETRIKRGQLRNSELTLAELSIVKESFIRGLISIHHGRPAYEKSRS